MNSYLLYLFFFNPDLSFNAALFLSYPIAPWLNKVDGEKWSNRLQICSTMICVNEHWTGIIHASNMQQYSLAFAITRTSTQIEKK